MSVVHASKNFSLWCFVKLSSTSIFNTFMPESAEKLDGRKKIFFDGEEEKRDFSLQIIDFTNFHDCATLFALFS